MFESRKCVWTIDMPFFLKNIERTYEAASRFVKALDKLSLMYKKKINNKIIICKPDNKGILAILHRNAIPLNLCKLAVDKYQIYDNVAEIGSIYGIKNDIDLL